MRRLLPDLFLILSLFALIPSDIQAEQLTLETCLKLVKEQNPAIKTARWEQAVAKQQIRQADSALYPRIDLQGGYTAQLESQAIKVNNEVMETQQPLFAFASLGVTQTIYDFGRRDSKREQAKAASSVVGSVIRTKEQEAAIQVIEVYFGILEAEKLNITAMDELKTVEEHRRVALALYENGSVTRNDLLQAEVRIASSKQKLLAVKNRDRNLRLRLNFLLGLPANQKHELMEPSREAFASVKPDAAEDRISKRPDLQAIRSQIEVSEYEVKEKKTSFYPELFAKLSVDYLQNDKMREQAIYGGTVGLKINIFDGFASSSALEKAVATRSRIKQQLKQSEEEASLELATAINDVMVSRERIEVARAAINQGEENLRINKIRYQERVGTATEVLDAQTLLTQARAEYYSASYDYQVASARIKKAKGEL